MKGKADISISLKMVFDEKDLSRRNFQKTYETIPNTLNAASRQNVTGNFSLYFHSNDMSCRLIRIFR